LKDEVIGVVGTRPLWGDIPPLFLVGPEIEEGVEPLVPGDTSEYTVERRENWEKAKLRPAF